jgi:hypothetical protein
MMELAGSRFSGSCSTLHVEQRDSAFEQKEHNWKQTRDTQLQ